MDKRFVWGFWLVVVLLFAIGIVGPRWERKQAEEIRRARREESQRRLREFDKPIPTQPWITCTGEGQYQNCVVRQLPAPQ